MPENPLLEVKNLKVYFYMQDAVVRAVEGLNFSIHRGEIVGLAGESGCGKSVTTQAILRLVPAPGKIEEGEILLNGTNLLALSREEMRLVRGSRISIVFQNALAALNPVIQIGEQVADVYQDHKGGKFREARRLAVSMMRKVGITMPEDRQKQFPTNSAGVCNNEQ